jgi:SPP1 family predicted phage head-tail adaptor
MQGAQEAAMQDTCKIGVYSRTLDTYGGPVETWTEGSAIACGVEMTTGQENRRADLTAERIDATVRLPIGTSIKATDRVKVTHRFGADTTDITYDVVGEIRRGPSGLQVDLQEILP